MDDDEVGNIFSAIDSGVLSEEHVCALQRRIQKKGRCFNCGRPGHIAKDCRGPKRKPGQFKKVAEEVPGSTPRPARLATTANKWGISIAIAQHRCEIQEEMQAINHKDREEQAGLRSRRRTQKQRTSPSNAESGEATLDIHDGGVGTNGRRNDGGSRGGRRRRQ